MGIFEKAGVWLNRKSHRHRIKLFPRLKYFRDSMK
jgi:hypothetical protein